MANKGFHVYQDYGEYEYSEEEELAEPDFYVDRYYPNMDIEDEDMMDGGLAPFSVSEILEHCIEPTLTDGLKHMGKIIIWCVIFRTVTQISHVPAWLCHLTSMITGALLAMHFFGTGISYIFALILLGYIMLGVSKSVRGMASAAFILSYNIVCETWIADGVTWHMVRGPIMILAMKIISLGFDMDTAEVNKEKKEKLKQEQENIKEKEEAEKLEEKNKHNSRNNGNNARNRNKKKRVVEEPIEKENEKDIDELDLTKLPGILEFAGYCLCPGTIVLGPWVSYEEYNNIYKDPKWNFTWLIKIIFTVLFAFMFLTIR